MNLDRDEIPVEIDRNRGMEVSSHCEGKVTFDAREGEGELFEDFSSPS